jgi:hypothetical protein
MPRPPSPEQVELELLCPQAEELERLIWLMCQGDWRGQERYHEAKHRELSALLARLPEDAPL